MPPRIFGVLALAVIGLSACATPVPPSGGPVDRSPPQIVRSEPATGSVRVSGRTVRVEFADWMDENSIERGLSITPEPDARPTIRWRRRAVEITFQEDFRPNTTYVLTFDRNLRTFRGGTFAQPVSIAFSTGDQIDAGRLSGRVVEPLRGDPVQGIDIFAYAGPALDAEAPPPASLPERPAYRTQTGSDGSFALDHVREGAYFIIALEDVNRNRRLDAGEPFAPPPQAWVLADTLGAPLDKPWIIAAQDTLAPVLNRVRTLSLRHLELRFGEAVVLPNRDPEQYRLAAIDGPQPPDVATVFARAADRRFVYLTLAGPIAEGEYSLRTGPIADTLGNASAGLDATFTATPSPDTLRQRFISFIPDTTALVDGSAELLAWQRPGFRLSLPTDTMALRQSVSVTDTLDVPRNFSLSTTDGTTYRVEPAPALAEGEYADVRVRLDGIDAAQRFRRLDESEIGEITGTIERANAGDLVVIELFESGESTPLTQLRLSDEDAFMFTDLPEGDYRIRAFVDREGYGRWDAGSILPYRPAAPMRWVGEVVSVRPRWETTLPAPITFADPPDLPLPETDEDNEVADDL